MDKNNTLNDTNQLQMISNRSEQKNKKINVDFDKIQKLESEIKSLKENYSTKKFLVKISEDIAKKIKEFLITKGQWKYNDAIGLVECVDQLDEQLKNKPDLGFEGLYLGNLTLEAINYFYSLESGKGYQSATEYLKQIKPLSETLIEARKEYDDIQYKEFQLASLQEGLEMPPDQNKK